MAAVVNNPLAPVRDALRQQKWEEALTMFGALPEPVRETVPALVLRGRAHYGAGRLDDAATSFAAIIERDADHVEALTVLARIAYRRKQWKVCADLARHIMAVDATVLDAYMMLGRAGAMLDDVPLAIAGYRGALDRAPDNLEALKSLLRLYKRSGEHAAAVEVGRRLLALGADDPEIRLALLRAESAVGDHAGVLATAPRVLAAQPEQREALILLGRALVATHKDAEALDLWKRIAVQGNPPAEAELQLGRLSLRGGNPQAAAAQLESYLKARPDHVEAHLDLAKALSAAERWREAWSYWARLRREHPKDLVPTVALLRVASGLGRWQLAKRIGKVLFAGKPAHRAATDYIRIVSLGRAVSPEAEAAFKAVARDMERLASTAIELGVGTRMLAPHGLTWRAIAIALFAARRWRAAAAAAEYAIGQSEPKEEAMWLLAQARVNLKQWDEAEPLLRAVAAARPRAPEPVRLLFQVAQTKNDMAAATAWSKALIAFDPQAFENWRGLARSLFKDGHTQESLDAWREAAQIDPQSIEAQLGVANAAIALEQYEVCEEAARTVLVREPDNVSALRFAARVAVRLGRIAEGLALWQRLMNLEPSNVEAPLQCARLHRKLDDNASALICFVRVLELDPNHIEAIAAAGRIYRGNRETSRAVPLWEKWASLAPDAIEPRLYLARVSRDSRQVNDSIRLYKEILQLDPRDERAMLELSDLMLKGR